MPFPLYLIVVALIVATGYLIIKRFKIIQGQEVAIIEVFGKPKSIPVRSGLFFLIPFHRIRFRLDLRQRQVERTSDVKTKDDAFVKVSWVLRYRIKDDNQSIMDYAYKVEAPVDRLVFKVENEIRQIISSMTMDELYSQRDVISSKVKNDQASDALETGLWIEGVVIEQPLPPIEVQNALNNKLASIAQQEAAKAQAEAKRITLVGIAKAESESKKLQGEGIAQERQAIIDGFAKSVETLKGAIPSSSEQDILKLIEFTMQADMVTTASNSGKATVIFVPTNMSQGISTPPITIDTK